MTLFKAVEAARDSYGRCIKRLEDFKREFGGDPMTMAMIPHAKNCLAALPDKPMTEDEIFKIIHQIIYHGFGSGVTTTKVIEALKAANVLYVKED